MGNTISYYAGYEVLTADQLAWHQEFNYSIFDPTQTTKPTGRTKDIISYYNKDYPHQLQKTAHLSCDTVWKGFKRQAWRIPNHPFLGDRQ